MSQIYHAHLYGTRNHKYDWLQTHDALSTDWKMIGSVKPLYLLIPQDNILRNEYMRLDSLNEIMPLNSIGINSHRDHFAISFDDDSLLNKILDFISDDISDVALASKYHLNDTNDFRISVVRDALKDFHDPSSIIKPCVYRPFDNRFILYHPTVLDRPRPNLNRHFLRHGNIAGYLD